MTFPISRELSELSNHFCSPETLNTTAQENTVKENDERQNAFEKLLQKPSKRATKHSGNENNEGSGATPAPYPQPYPLRTYNELIAANAIKQVQTPSLNRNFVASGASTTTAAPTQRAPLLTDLDSLQLRITQGPLAGFILQASRQSGQVQLRLRSAEGRPLEKTDVHAKALALLFGENLNSSLILEINHADHDAK